MRTPEVEAAMKRSVTDTELVETKTPPWNRETLASVDRRTLAAEVERLETDAKAMTIMLRGRGELLKHAEAAEARVAELEAQNARLREALGDEYQRVAPVIADYPVQPWEHLGEGRMRGTWAEDGSPYHFAIPFQLVPAFQAMQRLANLTKRQALADGKAAP